MEFVKRVVRLKETKPQLSPLERTGDPQVVASSFVDLHATKEFKPIKAPRASSLYKACMRKHVIGTVLKLSEPDYAGGVRSKLIYGIGNSVHYWLQNSPDVFGNARVGWWKCQACGTVRYFGLPRNTACKKCGAKPEATIYYEHGISLTKPYIMTGHPDMFFKIVPTDAQAVIRGAELKTMEGEAFDSLVAPLIEHVWQSQTYMWACAYDKKLPVKVDKNVWLIFYITKRGRAKEFPLKCFPIVRDTLLIKRITDKLDSYQKGLVNYPKNLPAPAVTCSRKNFTCWEAKSCVALDECRRNL